ncbi:ATP-binding protein [Salinibius halmophilus]|uniref:ATP-binding protein n=1 Tax=Salinibius halmophilus TaxID=1853216 RepID=UPI000E66AC97|nr:ATP-binding protein [Salinibius halmophilus]
MEKAVSCKVLATIFDSLTKNGVDHGVVVRDTQLSLATLKDPKERITWAEFSQIFRNIEQHGNYTRQDFIDIGLGIFETPVVQMLGVIARTLYTLPEFYLWYHNQDKSKLNKSLTSCVYTECSHDHQLNFVIRLHLIDDAEPIEAFFLTSLGVVKGWPKLYGLPPIDVTMSLVPNGCEYRFRCPKTGGPLNALRKLLMWPFTARASAEHLVLTNNEIYEYNRRLEEENAKLRAAEVELQEAIFQAQQASQVKTNFINNITHEIRTPLNAVMGLNSLCIESQATRENLDSHLMMQTAIDRLVYTFEDIIEFNLLSDEAASLQLSVNNAHNWVQQQITTLINMTREQQLEIIDQNKLPKDLSLELDWQRIAQVLRILTSNALKFTVQGYISLRAEFTEDNLQICICDTGSGIDNDALQHLFEPLHRIEREWTRTNTGIGLGLPLAKASIEQMHGSIEYQPNQPNGSCFQISVPASPANSLELELDTDKQLTILLAEDNNVNSIIFKRMAEILGHTMYVVENGQLATEFVKKHKVDLVLMDLMMPVMDGVSASKIIRQHFSPNELPIVAVSANITPHDFDGLLSIGINQCATKPLNLEMFQSLIRPYY